jgi:hypothetical protein
VGCLVRRSLLLATFGVGLNLTFALGRAGLLFTIADRIGASELSIVGPENIRHLVASWRSFFMRSAFPVIDSASSFGMLKLCLASLP